MNKKVLKTMIALVVIFLAGLYILKIFFPEQFVLSIKIKPLVTIGNYVDNHIVLAMLFGFILGFTTDYLYFGAVCRRKWVGFVLLSIIITYNIVFECIYYLLPTDIVNNYSLLISAASSCYMIFVPMFFTDRIKELSITYSINYISQALSLSIRNFDILLVGINSISMLIFSCESYLWLLLLFIYFNYKKEEKTKWDMLSHCTETYQESNEKSTNSTKRLNLFRKIGLFFKQNLTKNNLKRLLRKAKLKLKIFLIYELWIYAIVIGSIALCSWIFNRWIEGIMFCIAHVCIRRVFNKQFHFNCTAYCLMLTLAIAWFAIPITLPMATSLLSSIPIAFLVCFFGFVAQDRVDLLIQVRNLQKYSDELLDKINNKDIYAMNEDELYQHCRDCGLSEEDCKIAYFIVIERLKGKELYNAIGYCERQTIRKRKKILEKIK